MPSTTLPSSIDPRDYWARQGVSWREILDLHSGVVDLLRSSSWWSS